MKMKWLVFSALVLVANSQSPREVITEYGTVRGHWSEEHSVWKFLGIPYATPPIGENRFKAPLPPQSWSETLDAVNDSIRCIQLIGQDDSDSEDCLIINVFVPNTASDEPLPVLFYVHGGGFIFGSGNGYNPYHITRHDVILVTFNYRLGPLGFLCLGTEAIPGNAGFKDQIAALRWVNKNIANFGGDPLSVTIYGDSAGGQSIDHLILTRVTDGLFQKAIVESGSSLMYTANSYNRLGRAKSLGLNLGFMPVDNLDALTDFLKSASSERLSQDFSWYSPCIEKEIEEIEIAIKEFSLNTLASDDYAKVPILFTFANMEGITFAPTFVSDVPQLENNFADFLPGDLTFSSTSERNQVADSTKEFYFGSSPVTVDSAHEYVQYLTDMFFFNPMYRSALHHARDSNPVYFMEFSYRGGFSIPNINFPNLQGAGHSDMVAHILDYGFYNNDTLAEDQVIRDRMTVMWTNFMKYGDPTPATSQLLPVRWPQFSIDQQNYLSMSRDMVVGPLPAELQARARLWVDIYNEHLMSPPVFPNSAIIFGTNSLLLLICYVSAYLVNY